MTSETTVPSIAIKAKPTDPAAGPAGSTEDAARSVLAQQQENEASDDEEFLSDTAEVVDANDATQYTESLNLDLKSQDEKVWLVRVPRFLAHLWRDREAMQGQTLGTIKIKKTIDDGKVRKPTMKLKLADTPLTHDLPHDYELQLTKPIVENQYVFSEKNFQRPPPPPTPAPVKKEKVKKEGGEEEDDDDDDDDDDHINDDDDNDNEAEVKEEEVKEMSVADKEFQRRLKFIQRKKRRFNKYKNKDGTDRVIPFVKTIPKNTALRGTVVHEAQLIPSIQDPNYSKIIASRKQYFKEEPRPSVTLLQEHSGVTLSNAGLTLKTDTSTFLKTADTKKSKQENRAIRMDRTELLNLLFKLFDEYDYWSLKGLKERTKQPEVYLKDVLEGVATLIKKGPYALRYALKKEFKELKDQERIKRAGELGKEDEDDDDEDNDEDIEMEDVV